ncbi:MAG: pyridoxal 5'-phosphate synthase lyase subunit PdxS, partial [Candidatus Bathyarchaeia archaeon]
MISLAGIITSPKCIVREKLVEVDVVRGTTLVKRGFAHMLKHGVIMDVTNVEQAQIAEDAGAVAVMVLDKLPYDVRMAGGVARAASLRVIEEVLDNTTIPVMAKCRIGHFVEAQVLEALGVDYIDESEVLTPADETHHIWKHDFKVPF